MTSAHAWPRGDARRSCVSPFDKDNLLGKGEDVNTRWRSVAPGRSPESTSPPAFAFRRRAEWAELGQRRLSFRSIDHRRREDGRPRLAHADGMSVGGPRAATVSHRRRNGAARHVGLCAHQGEFGLPVSRSGGRRRAPRAHHRDGLRHEKLPTRDDGGDGFARRSHRSFRRG